MAQYLVAIHHPDDHDPSLQDEAMHRDIGALNDEMKAAGSGSSSRTGRTSRPRSTGGFWVLKAADLSEALAWGRKADIACRAPVEVRQFN